MLLSILSCTKPILVSVPAGWRKCQRAPAPVQHPRTDLWHQQSGPGPSADGGLHLNDVQRSAGPTPSPCRWKHSDCRGGCPSRRQQLAIRGRRFLQLGLTGKLILMAIFGTSLTERTWASTTSNDWNQRQTCVMSWDGASDGLSGKVYGLLFGYKDSKLYFVPGWGI